ncbi:MAG: hypothetical protein HY866_02270, partial [Chloroflexi bacterium]|nr:hypothetical protein [Chloroflexota bacterium]
MSSREPLPPLPDYESERVPPETEITEPGLTLPSPAARLRDLLRRRTLQEWAIQQRDQEVPETESESAESEEAPSTEIEEEESEGETEAGESEEAPPTGTEPSTFIAEGEAAPTGEGDMLPAEPQAAEETPEPAPEEAAPQTPEEEVEAVEQPETIVIEAPDEEPEVPTVSEDTRAELQAWRERAMADTSAIPRPELQSGGQGGAAVRGQGGSLAGRHQADPNALARDARGAVSPPPEARDVPTTPPEVHPVPAAPRLVEENSHGVLSPQHMPVLENSPRGTTPVLGQRPQPPPPPPSETVVAVRDEAAAPEADPNQEHVEEIRETAEEEPEVTEEAQADPYLIETQPPPAPPELPPGAQVAIGAVVARLLAEPERTAEEIITDIRSKPYEGELRNQFPDIGTDDIPTVTNLVTIQLREVAVTAGVTQEALDAAIQQRQQELVQQSGEAHSEIETAGTEAETEVQEAGQTELDAVAGAHTAVDQHTERQLEAVSGENDPTVIRRKRDRLKSEINRAVGRQRVAYDQAQQQREQQLEAAKQTQVLAYRAAAQQDQRVIEQEARDAEREPNWQDLLAQAEIRNWINARERGLDARVVELKQAAQRQTDGFKGGLGTAAFTAREMIEDWADSLLQEHESWWDRIWRMFSDWSETANAEAEAWEVARAGETRTAILVDFGALHQFTTSQGETVDLESNAAFQQLSLEQQAVVRAYYSTGPEARDPIMAVAAGIKVRLANQRRADTVRSWEDEIANSPSSEWHKLDAIGQAQNSSFSADRIRNTLYDAMFGGVTGWGTDEAAIFGALNSLTRIQAAAVRKCYNATHSRDLDDDLESELSGSELGRARAQLSGDPILADVATLRDAMAGLGTDEDLIFSTLRNKSAEERQRIIDEYRRQYNVDLTAELDSEMGGHELDRADALMEGDVARADAIAIDQAMRGGWTGLGTDEAAIEQVYQNVRQDVISFGAQQQPPWTTAQIEAEVLRRNQNVEQSYQVQYGGDWTAGDESALRQAFHSELSGPELNLANALADNDLIAADAARIAIEEQSIFYTDDDVVNGVLENQYNRALEEVRRDNGGQLRELRERARREGWDPYRLRESERALERQWERLARDRSQGYMSQLEDQYDSEYSRWGTGGLRTVIEFNMSGYDQERARELLAGGGYLSPARQLHYAVMGVGTNEEAIRQALQGRSPAEIEEIRREWARAHPGESLDERLNSELSGRDQFDTNMLLQGEPENAEQELVQMRERTSWELRNSSGFLSGEQRRVLELRRDELNEQYDTIQNAPAGSPERTRALQEFRRRSGNVNVAIEGYRTQVDSVTDSLATAAELAVVITAAVVAGIFSGGTGTVAIMAAYLGTAGGAALTAVVAAGAGMAIRYAMKGDAYGVEDILTDATIGIVDAAVSGLTFGTSKVLLEAGEQALKGAGRFARFAQRTVNPERLIEMARSQSRMTRMFAHGIAEGAEGFVSSFPTAVASNLINDQHWEHGNPLANIGLGILTQTGMGTFMSMGMGSLGGFGRPDIGGPSAGRLDDLLRRGDPADMEARWRAFQAENPNATVDDFMRDFDANPLSRMDEAAAAHQMQQDIQDALQLGLPPQMRTGPLSDIPSEVVDEANFARLAGSQPGPAVLIEIDGRPRLIVLEGADPRALQAQAESLGRSVIRDLEGRPRLADQILPPDLRRNVPVAVDPELPGNTVRVHYDIDPNTGLVVNIRMSVGPEATVRDIELHARTARMMRRYAGFTGQVRQLIDRARAMIGLRGTPPPGSRAWEAMLEIDKLPRIIDDRMRQLQDAIVDSVEHRRLLDDISSLQRQLDEHDRIFRELEVSPSRGYVAAEAVPRGAQAAPPRSYD